jgi:hypothetical protein
VSLPCSRHIVVVPHQCSVVVILGLSEVGSDEHGMGGLTGHRLDDVPRCFHPSSVLVIFIPHRCL